MAVFLIPWLLRYLPWRYARWERLNAGDRVIKRCAPDVSAADLQRVLAARAINRMEYDDLLDYTPDPIGDFVAGRFDRLSVAELASTGLRPREGSAED